VRLSLGPARLPGCAKGLQLSDAEGLRTSVASVALLWVPAVALSHVRFRSAP